MGHACPRRLQSGAPRFNNGSQSKGRQKFELGKRLIESRLLTPELNSRFIELPKSLPNFAPTQPESCRIAPTSTGVSD